MSGSSPTHTTDPGVREDATTPVAGRPAPDDQPLRRALLTLHRELLEEQRRSAERFGGRMGAAEVLQAATEDFRFGWLTTLSALMAELDAARGEDDGAHHAATLDRLRALLVAPDPATTFGARYLRALQDHPAVVFAHRDVVAAIPAPDGSPV